MKRGPLKAKGPGIGSVLWNLLPAALLTVLFASVGIMHVTSRVAVMRVGYQLSKLDNENRDLSREHDRLKLELATLRNPVRLEKLARERLGMIAPPASSVVTVGKPTPRLGRAGPTMARTFTANVATKGSESRSVELASGRGR
jgi:cell division protein FtsL